MKTTRKRMPRMSARRKRERVIYERTKKAFLDANDLCWCCARIVPRKRRELHHRKGRSGTLYLDVKYFMMLCGPCHRRVHNKPAWAIKHGLLAGAGEWKL